MTNQKSGSCTGPMKKKGRAAAGAPRQELTDVKV